MTNKIGLLLEGGGMRSAFTAGVLDYFLDKGIEIPIVSTTSASAVIGSSYISKQRDRNFKILKELSDNPQSISFGNMVRNKELFGMDYIFEQIPETIIPLDFETFSKSPIQFIISTTEVNSGTPLYFDTYETKEDLLTITRASCSLPVLAPSVQYNGIELMDGGIAEPIPITPLINRETKKIVVVLTQNRGYIKKATRLNWFFKRVFKDKPELVRLLKERHHYYNQTIDLLLEKEKKQEVFIIQPENPLQVSRIEQNGKKLQDLYIHGYTLADKKMKELHTFLESENYQKIS